MLNAGRCAQFAVIERSVAVVRINPAKRQYRRERPLGRVCTAGTVACKHKISDITVTEIVVERSHNVLTIECVSTPVRAYATVVVNKTGVEVVVTKEGVLVVDSYARLRLPPLTSVPITESEVCLFVSEYIQRHIILVADGTVVTFVAILMSLVGVFSVDSRIGITRTDKHTQAIKQKIKLLRQFGIHPQLALMGLVES